MAALRDLNVGTIFSVALGIFFLAALIPAALTQIFGANQTDWDATSVTLWTLIPLAVIAAVVMIFIPRSGKGA